VKQHLIIRMEQGRQGQLCVEFKGFCEELRHLKPCVAGACGERDVRLDVYRVGCPVEPCRPPPCNTCGYCDPCAHRPKPQPAIPLRGVRYTLLEIDQCGRACFMLDEKVLDQKVGRYDAYLFLCGEEVGQFQIDLRKAVKIKSISNLPQPLESGCPTPSLPC
jgi:hypothetical protein